MHYDILDFVNRKEENGYTNRKVGQKMKKLLIALFVFALGMMITGDEVFGQSLAGTVTVDSVNAQRGDQIAVGIRLNGNTVDIGGLLAPIRYANNALKLDSVSFIGSFITNDYAGLVDTVSDSDIIRITYIPTTFSSPMPRIFNPNGLLATLFFRVKDDAPPGNSPIDSVNITEIRGGFPFEVKFQFSNPDGDTTYYPEFEAGNVAILVPTDINDDINSGLPTEFTLSQNYPNPFNPSTIIAFSLPTASDITLEIFNVLGQRVVTLASGRYAAGRHQFEFDASELTSGLFFYRLTHQNGVETKKMLLLK